MTYFSSVEKSVIKARIKVDNYVKDNKNNS